MRLPSALLTLFLLMALNGCATIIHGTTQDIDVKTDLPALTCSSMGKIIINPRQ
jgi:hypothetical protein